MTRNFEWKEEYSLDIKEIDNQHMELIKLINKLYDAINRQSTRQNLSAILKELIEYSQYHFSTEEKYFIEFGYEHMNEHIKEHKKFSDKMIELNKNHKNKEIEISFDLIDFLEDWLLDHVMSADKKYVPCFKKHGL